MQLPEDLEARTFLAALFATLALFVKPILWAVFILGMLTLMLVEPMN